MIRDVRLLGALMQKARPAELTIGNIARRILHLIREEAEVMLQTPLFPDLLRILGALCF